MSLANVYKQKGFDIKVTFLLLILYCITNKQICTRKE